MTPSRRTIHLIPHTHWDREWYLSRSAFQARLAFLGDALVDFLGGESASRFVLDGQTILVQDLLAIRPDLTDAVVDAVRSGRLDVGPWYVLADEQIPTGESLVRNLIEGARDAAHLGRRMDVCYSPDAFGHPAALPLIAAGFGLRNAVVWRGPALADDGDRDLRRWRAADGSELLVYHLPPAGYEIGIDLVEAGADVVERWRAMRGVLFARAVSSEVAVFVGADHHLPPESLDSVVNCIARAEPDDDVRISTLTEYFAAANLARAQAPVVSGELRWSGGRPWTLQGVHGTRIRMKRQHGAAELALWRRAEPLAALARLTSLPSAPAHRALLRSAWRNLVASQFHDTIGGCCSDDVAREQAVRLDGVFAVAREIARDALHRIVGHAPDSARTADATPTLVLWNPASRERGGMMIADVTCFRRDVIVGPPSGRVPRDGEGFEPFALVLPSGTTLPVQVLSRTAAMERLDSPRHYPDQDEVERVTVAFECGPIPGFGFAVVAQMPSPLVPAHHGLEVSAGRLANRFVVVSVSDTGSITIDDRRTGERYADLFRLEDQCDSGDTYTPYIRPDVAPVTRKRALSRGVASVGPFIGCVTIGCEMRSAGAGDLTCRLDVTLHADSPLVRVRFEIDNCATNHRLRAHCPVGAGDGVFAGESFGVARRVHHHIVPGTSPHEIPVQTAPAHRFVAAGAGARALAILAPSFFEYEWVESGELIVTLIRSVGELSRGDLPPRPGHAAWPMPTPDAQEQGRHVIEFALAPMDGEVLDHPHRLEQMWEDVFLPIEGTFLRTYVGSACVPSDAGVTLEGPGLVFSTLKPSESTAGVVVRCYNVLGETVHGGWRLAFPVQHAAVVRLDETLIENLAVVEGTFVPIVIGPHAVLSVLLTA